jgi:hypothetical protein
MKNVIGMVIIITAGLLGSSVKLYAPPLQRCATKEVVHNHCHLSVGPMCLKTDWLKGRCAWGGAWCWKVPADADPRPTSNSPIFTAGCDGTACSSTWTPAGTVVTDDYCL